MCNNNNCALAMKVKIIGNGAWGNALHNVLRENCSSVSMWNKSDGIADVDTFVLALPTQSIRSVLALIASQKKYITIINASKGIEQTTHKLPFQIATELFRNDLDYFCLTGPSFANEVIKKMPTIVNLGYMQSKNKEIVKNLFQTDYFRVRIVKGVMMLEMAGAFKNIYAITCGLADGLGFGTNTRVKLIILAMEEFYRLCRKLHLGTNIAVMPGAVGDLILTCNSTESRNFRFGKMLARCPAKESLQKIGSTVEGYYTVSSIPYFVNKYKVELPLALLTREIIIDHDHSKIRKKFIDFIKRV